MATFHEERPGWVRDSKPQDELFLDLGRYLRHGLEPLPDVESLLRELRPCQVLHLNSVREPTALYALFGSMGFERYTEKSGGKWDVYLHRCPAPPPGPPS